MKKLLSLVITMVMVVSMGIHVFSEEIGTEFSSEVAKSRVIMDDAVYKHLVDQYSERFFYSEELKQLFLDRVAQMEEDSIVIDDHVLRDIYRDIIQEDRASRMANNKLASAKGTSEISSKEQPLIMSRSTSTNLFIDNPVFMSGFEGNTMVENMMPGFMSSRFTVRNDNIEAKSIMAIVKLQSKDTNALRDVAIVDKVIAADTSETITAGFNVPNDAENYEIKITLWDNNMNLQTDIITFPEPHAIMTVANGTSYFWAYLSATDNVVVEYNGKADTYVSNGDYVSITVQELISTPIIIKGDLIGMLSDFGYITSFDGTGLSNLSYLNLEFNQLSSFDGTGLSNLTTLFIGGNRLSSFDGTGLSNLTSLFIGGNQLSSFDGTGFSNLTSLDLWYNLNLSVVTIPEFEDVPSGSGGLRYLSLEQTALGSQSSINSVWNDIIANLPIRNNSYKGYLYVSNTALKTALQNALNTPINKYWTVTLY